MMDRKKMNAVLTYAQTRCGYELVGMTNVYDSDGKWWDVLVLEEVRGDGKTVLHFTLMGQDSDGTISHQVMECCMWQYLGLYPETARDGMIMSLDTVTVHKVDDGLYGVTYHTGAWNSFKEGE